MPYDLSAEQRQAIELRGGNILVAAGAGSGKTTVLVERVLSLISGDDATDLDRLLVLTFTNAAAAEMRSRIEEGLAQRLQLKPGDGHLLRQLALAQHAPITTIHAFCLEVVRRHFYLLELDAGFRIPSEMERAILQEETLNAFLEREYEAGEATLQELAGCYGGPRGDAALARLIGELYSFSMSQPHPEEWLKQAARAFSEPGGLDDYVWSGFLLAELKQELVLAKESLLNAVQIASQRGIAPAWLQQGQEELAALDEVLGAGHGLGGFCAALAALSFAPLPRAKAETAEEEIARQEFRDRRDMAKSQVNGLKQQFGRRAPQDMLADLHKLAPLMEHLCRLAADYGIFLSAEKRRRNLLDFEDMEHFCLRLLEQEDNGVAAGLAASFDGVLIDEYQDINAVQERILRLLSRGDNSFAVGDVKQSIYRFRLAEPTLFLDKYRSYGQGVGGTRIDLNRNYRSDGAVIAAVNFLFRQLMSEGSAELDYDEAAELKAGRAQEGAAVELWLVERDEAAAPADDAPADDAPEEQAEEDTPEEPALAAEARLLGRRILELHAEGYAFSDMAVLLRAAKNRESLLAREFSLLGIPAVAASRADYLQTAEISLMLSLLAIIDNPLQEIALAAVLRSPLFAFSVDELDEMRQAAPEQQLLQGLEVAALAQGELAEKCQLFLARLAKWRRGLRCRRISELIGDIYRDTGLPQLAGALPGGGQRQENLLLLQQRAREYEAGSYRGLFRFLLFMADGRGKAAESGLTPGEEEQAVRVMSIHRSKGLEFPVVLVANLGGAFALMDERQDVIWHKELGLGPKMVERERRRKFPSLAQEAVARRLHREALAEEMRVLYVALTRASERLILSASVKDIPARARAWQAAIAGQGPRLAGPPLLRDKRPVDWLGKALLRHPDGGILREQAGIAPGSPEENDLVLRDSGHWRIRIVGKSELTAAGTGPAGWPGLDLSQKLAQSPYKQEVETVLSYRYPWREACGAAAKWTVTELNRLQQPPQAAEEAALLLTEEFALARETPPADVALAARRGLAQHKLLQYLDFSRAARAEAVAEQLTALVEQGLFPAAEAELVMVEPLARFAASELGQRLAASARVLRETPFSYALPARELNPQAAEEDKVVLQGMLDTAFGEADGWVLLDYKTGGAGQTEQQLKARYTAQIGYYRRALQDISGKTVKEAWLCFVDLGRNIKVE